MQQHNNKAVELTNILKVLQQPSASHIEVTDVLLALLWSESFPEGSNAIFQFVGVKFIPQVCFHCGPDILDWIEVQTRGRHLPPIDSFTCLVVE